MRKKIMAAVIIMALSIMGLYQPQSEVSAAAKPDADTVSAAYQSYIEENLSSAEEYPHGCSMLYDIDRDGVCEMFFKYLEGRCGYKIFTYKDGEVKELESFAGCVGIYYNKSKKQVCVLATGGAADNTYACYKMGSGQLVKVSEYKSVSDYVGGVQKVKYYKNGKKISKKTFAGQTGRLEKWKQLQDWE